MILGRRSPVASQQYTLRIAAGPRPSEKVLILIRIAILTNVRGFLRSIWRCSRASRSRTFVWRLSANQQDIPYERRFH